MYASNHDKFLNVVMAMVDAGADVNARDKVGGV